MAAGDLYGWLIGVGAAVTLMAAGYGLLIVLARRLPPGPLKDLAAIVPACVTTARRLLHRLLGPART